MQTTYWPMISIITPTLNSSRTIEEYIKSIKIQEYQGKVEILILDGGSTDDTLKIVKKYGAKIYSNKYKTGEAGKALGIKKSNGLIYAFIDSDNILPNKYWLTNMVKPFILSPEVLVSEPSKFIYRKSDFWLTRYFSLIGMGDPINLFIGNYDKYCYISNKWTNLNLTQEKKDGYFLVKLENKIPTIGANGSLIRKSVFDHYPVAEYLFDVDVLEYLIKKQSVYIAKTDEGIIHLFSGDISTFIRKQRRRIRDYLYYRSLNKRENSINSRYIYWGVIKFIISSVVVFPLLIQTLIGFIRKKDYVWIFHPIACYITLFTYTYESIRFLFIREKYSRIGWKQ